MKKKIKVAHLIATSFYGGPEKQIVEHLKLLNTDVFTGYVISFIENSDSNEIIQKASENNLETIGIPMSGPIDIRALRDLRKVVLENKIQLLCVHGYKACVLGWLSAKLTSINIIAFSRGYTSENIKVRFYEWLERQFLKRMDGVVCVSRGQEKKLQLLKVYPKKKWVVLNAVKVEDNREPLPVDKVKQLYKGFHIPNGSKLIVSAGRLSPEKGHRYFIEAISKIKKDFKDTFFVLCGDGMCKEELIALATQLNVIDICRFPGFRSDAQDIFKVMEFMVLPSLTEGLPNVVLEAFSNAKSVVATSVGGVPELVKDGVNGLLIDACDVEMLSGAIKKLSNDILSKEFGKSGLELVKKDFSFEGQTRKLQSIYLNFK